MKHLELNIKKKEKYFQKAKSASLVWLVVVVFFPPQFVKSTLSK